jgi:Tfp pilus assembly protein PilP
MANTVEREVNGRTLIFYPDSHRYKLKGTKEWLLSPSSIMGVIDKPMLIDWAVRMTCEYIHQNHGRFADINDLLDMAKKEWRSVRDEAADIGSQVHEWVEKWIKGKNPDIPADENVSNGILAFLKWQKEHNAQFTDSERLVYNSKLVYAGTTDAIAVIDGKKTVVDFKTGNYVGIEAYGQLVGYWEALNDEGVGIEQAVIIHLDKKTGNVESHFITEKDKEKYYAVFLYALNLKEALREVKNGNK